MRPAAVPPSETWPHSRTIRQYPKALQPRKLNLAWASKIRARIRENLDLGGSCITLAIHGYAKLNIEGKDGKLYKNMTPDTIFSPSKFPKYLEAGLRAKRDGDEPPYDAPEDDGWSIR